MDDEDDEDGFFVPHGYLSDGEGEPDDNDNAGLPKVHSNLSSLVNCCLFIGK